MTRPETNGPATTRRTPRLRPVALAVSSALVVIAIMGAFAEREQARTVQERRLLAIEHLATLRAKLEGAINATYQGLRSLAELEAASGGFSAEQFETLAAALVRNRPHVRTIGLSRGSVVVFVYPLDGYEAVLGLDYRDLPDTQLPAYDRAMSTGEAVLAGPLDLIQGGRAVIVRMPVRATDPAASGAVGMVSAPLMLDRLLDDVGIAAEGRGYQLAIRGTDALGDQGGPVFGDPGLFDRAPETLVAELPGGGWQMATVPVGGWNALAPVTRNLLIVGVALASLAGLISYRLGALSQERRAQARRLRRSEQRFRDYAESASDGFWEMGPDLRLSMVTGAFYDSFAAGLDHFIGRNRQEVAGDAGSPEWARHLAELEARRPFRNFRYHMVDDRGRKRWIEVGGTPFFSDDGAFAGYRGSLRDLTDLMESEQRNSAIIASALDAVVSIDAEGRIQEFNSAAEAMFGYSRDELLGRRMADFLMPERMRARQAAALATAAAGGGGHILGTRVTLPALRKDGAEFSAEVAVTRASHGGRVTFTAYLRDITESERAQRALAESERRYRTMVGSLSLGIVTHDATGRIVSANAAAEAITGRSAQELKALPPEGRPAMREDGSPLAPEELPAMVTLRTGRPCRDVVINILRPDGEPRWLSVNAAPVANVDTGANEAVISSFLDITEHRRTEENLRQAQKMEAVGQLTGGIAHDFNNLLAVMLGNLELLEERLTAADERQLLSSALRAIARGAELTQRLLAFSRHAPLLPKVTSLADLIGGMRTMLQTTLSEAIGLEIIVAPDVHPVFVDRAQIESVLLNLALNARDAMPGGGRVTITAQNVDLDQGAIEGAGLETPPGHYVALAVADTGTGMTQDILAHVFEPFFTTKDVGRGSGLGLSMVYGFVRQSGGTVGIDTAPGHGTTVRLYLPRSADNLVDTPSLPPAASQGNGESILVVEDQADVRALVVGLLENLGYRAHGVAEGSAALAHLETGAEVALMLTDVVLTGELSGPETVVRARELRPGLRVVFMSGYPKNSFAGDNALPSREPLLTKPFRKADFAQKIGEALDAGAADR